MRRMNLHMLLVFGFLFVFMIGFARVSDLNDVIKKNLDLEEIKKTLKNKSKDEIRNALLHGDEKGNTSLHNAVYLQKKNIISYLLETAKVVDADKDFLKKRNKDGNNSLHVAAEKKNNVDIIKILVKNGFDENSTGKNQNTPLHYAAMNGAANNARCLIKLGANISVKNVFVKKGKTYSYTPKYYAEKGKHIEVVKVLLEETPEGRGIFEAAQRGFSDLVEIILKKYKRVPKLKDKAGNNPLHFAAKKPNNIEIIKLLIKNGADVNAQNTASKKHVIKGHVIIYEKTISRGSYKEWIAQRVFGTANDLPLHIAAATKQDNVKNIEILLKNGAKINHKNKYKITPLHMAVLFGSLNNVKYLVEKGADIGHVTSIRFGQTTKRHESPRDMPDVYKTKETSKDREGDAVSFAAYMGVFHGYTIEKFLLENIPGGKGIFGAIGRGYMDPVKKILKKYIGAASLRNSDGNTPLLTAVAGKNVKLPIIKALLKAKADSNVKDKKGNTPSHYAAETGNLKLFKLLKSHGANFNIKNKKGMRPVNLVIDIHKMLHDLLWICNNVENQSKVEKKYNKEVREAIIRRFIKVCGLSDQDGQTLLRFTAYIGAPLGKQQSIKRTIKVIADRFKPFIEQKIKIYSEILKFLFLGRKIKTPFGKVKMPV